MRIAPSILAADFSNLWECVKKVESVEILHLDVMDGHFVPNISIGPPVIKSLRPRTDMYFDTHLMIERPERYIKDFQAVGVDRLIIHEEATDDTAAVIDEIDACGMDAGVAINPETSVERIAPLVDDVDVVLVMGTNPGFGGQQFIEDTVGKIERLNEITDTEIEVDGGVDAETGRECAAAGADTFVIGSSLFGKSDVTGALTELRRDIFENRDEEQATK